MYDGRRPDRAVAVKDADTQTDMSEIAAFWEGFYDPHTNLKEYFIHVGTCKGCQDLVQDQTIGLTEG